MQKKYFHEISDEEVKKLIKEKKTVGYLMKNYDQPKWCGYPNALEGVMGCWSLTSFDLRKNISIGYCKSCDCFKDLYKRELLIEKI